jgi:hypothetical protein
MATMKHSDSSPSAIRRFASQHLGPPSAIRRGSLTTRLVKCSRPGCPCKDRPEARHGPYFSLTRSVEGKTQSRLIPQDRVDLVRRQIENGRRFRDAVELHWQECERQADEELKGASVPSAQEGEKGGSSRRSKRRLRESSKR